MQKMLCCLTACLGFSLVACGSGQKEVKAPEAVPAQVQYDAAASPEVTTSGDAGMSDATPPQPPAPDAQPPSAQPPTVEVVVDGLTRPLADGETLKVDRQRMLFFYSSEAAPDCSNVQVSGLITRTLAGLCQVAFLPLEQGIGAGQEREVSITVTVTARATSDAGPPSVTRRFRVGVL